MTEPIPREVRLPKCYCPGTPHPDGDLFVLPAELSPRAGIAAATALSQVGETGDAGAALVNAILVNGGISSWNLVDAEGDALPLTSDNVSRRATWMKGGLELSNAVYAQFVHGNLIPLGLRSSRKSSGESSPNGQTEDLTSVKTPSSSKRPARSK